MGSIAGSFALIAFIGGLFCRRLRTASIAGAVPALLYGLLVVIGLWDILGDANLPFILGALAAVCLAILLAAVLASLLRRGIAALFGRRARSPLS
ncbi:MAG TPA: hypothetical protein VHK26_05520 [Methyloceanibacter sp.]|jgi:Na+/proline symporter|nr:hypothetical protein [Methyloceanibacter sp.]